MRSRSKHSLAAHCDSACGRSGLSLSGVTAVAVESDGTPSHHTGSVKYTERSERAPYILVYCAPLSLFLGVHYTVPTYIYTEDTQERERERGKERASSEIGVSVGRLGLRGVGRLDTGLGSMHTARPPSLPPRRYLARSSSLNPFGHIVDFAFSFVSSSLFLFLSFHLFVPFFIYLFYLRLFLSTSFVTCSPSFSPQLSLCLCIYILLFVLNGRSSLFGFSCALRVEPRQSTNPVRRGETAGTAG